MNNDMLYGHVRDGPLHDILGHIPHFSNRELKIAELSNNGNSDDEIAKIMKMNIEELSEIRKRIRKRALDILHSE